MNRDHSPTPDSISPGGAPDDRGDALLSAFFAEASELGPAEVPSASRLLWRAEILARLEEADRRAERAVWPTLLALVVFAGALVVCGALALVDLDGMTLAEGSNALARWLTASPWRPVAFAGGVLGALMLALPFLAGSVQAPRLHPLARARRG